MLNRVSSHIRVIMAAIACFGIVLAAAIHSRNNMGRRHPHSHFIPASTDPDASCGPVSLSVVSHYFNSPVEIGVFNRLTNAGESGVCSMEDLRFALRNQGYEAIAIRYPKGRVPAHRLPMILYVDRNHFLTTIPVDNGAIVIDPPNSPYFSDWRSLEERWTGESLVASPSSAELQEALRDEDLRF